MTKHTSVAYLLWLTGGLYGLHHLYLNRPGAAFVHTVTCNGWGFGWLRDFLTMPEYVRYANARSDASGQWNPKRLASPPVEWLALAMQIGLAHFAGTIASCLLPSGAPGICYELLFIAGAACSIQMTGDALRENTRASLGAILTVIASLVLPSYYLYGQSYDHVSYRLVKSLAIIAGGAAYATTRAWCFDGIQEAFPMDVFALRSDCDAQKQPTLNQRPRCCWWKTLLTYWALLALSASAMGTALVFHGTVVLEVDGRAQTFTAYEVTENVLRSEELQLLLETLADVLFSDQENVNFETKWEKLRETNMDVSGRSRYLRVLGVAPGASPREIKAAYRQLVLQWHPDKYSGDDLDQATGTFYEIQHAYEKLMESHPRDEL